MVIVGSGEQNFLYPNFANLRNTKGIYGAQSTTMYTPYVGQVIYK